VSEAEPAQRPRWLTRSVLAWALYDVASSAYAGIVPTFFGIYFVSVVAGELAGAQAWWGVITAIALVLAGGLAPLVGAAIDRRGRWFGATTAATALCVAATLLMPTGTPGRVVWTTVVFVAAQVGYTLATSVYDSRLVHVGPRSHLGRVSGFGWTIGTTGGMVVLAIAIALMHGVPADAQAARLTLAFLVAGGLYAVLAVIGLFGLRRLAAAQPVAAGMHGTAGGALAAVWATLRHWRRQRAAFRFLIAWYLINDVMVTLVFFVAIVIRARFGLTIEGMLWLAMLSHVISLPATLIFGQAADHFGPRLVINGMVAILAAGLLVLAFGTGTGAAVVAVALLGLVYASLQAVCRSFMASLVHPSSATEMFGFNAVVGRLSAAAGPLLFSAVAAASGSEAAALVSLLPFLILGVVVLGSVQVPEAPVAYDGAARQSPTVT
jgi:UMF1 family MFS transporter